MDQNQSRQQCILEVMTIIVILGITGLLHIMQGYKMVILNLYFLPVALGGLYLGRYRVGILALFSILCAFIVTALNVNLLAAAITPLIGILVLTVWAAVLGLTAILVGTLSDGQSRTLKELRVAHMNDTLSDALTEVANRRAFEYELTRRMAEWDRQQTPLALVLVDVDHFKKVNDIHGHPAGDAVLRGVAQTLKASMREMDQVARYGGEEFGIILPNTNIIEVKKAAERARAEVAASRFEFEGSELGVTVSVGIAHVLSGEDSVSLIKRADAALYKSKQAGRNCVHLHNGLGCEHFGAALPKNTSLTKDEATLSKSYTDTVIARPGHAVFCQELRRRVSESQRYQTHLSVMLVQVDDFETIVERGSRAGELVLEVTAVILAASLRDVDLVARYAENQFFVLLPETSFSNLTIPAHRIQQQVSKCEDMKYQGSPLNVTLSIGLAEVMAVDDADSVVHRATEAVQAASAAGQNRIYFHSGDACDPVDRELQLNG